MTIIDESDAERDAEREAFYRWEALTSFKREEPTTYRELSVWVGRWRGLLNGQHHDAILEIGRDIVRRAWGSMRRIGGANVPMLPILPMPPIPPGADEVFRKALDDVDAWCEFHQLRERMG